MVAPLAGILKLAASSDLRKASCTLAPKHATSPVLAISTPSSGSAPRRRVKENMGALTPTKPAGRGGPSSAGRLSPAVPWPIMTRVAASIKSAPTVLLTKGKEREARRLASISSTSPPLASSCMLNGPLMRSAAATLTATALTAASV